MKIAHDKARGPDVDLLPITEVADMAQCSVREILVEAGNGNALLYVALGRLAAYGVDTLGRKITNERRWAGGYVEFLPLYVPMIIQRGEADIVYYPFEEEEFPKGYESNSILYWRLEAPQRIGLAQIYVQRGHIVEGSDSTAIEAVSVKNSSVVHKEKLATWEQLSNVFFVTDDKDKNAKWFKTRCSDCSIKKNKIFYEARKHQGRPGVDQNLFDPGLLAIGLVEKKHLSLSVARKNIEQHFPVYVNTFNQAHPVNTA